MVQYHRAASKLDMYRKVPTDLMEGTKRGSILSYIALFTMTTLFMLETREFLSPRNKTDLALDASDDPRIRLNFNITMLDVKCEWAVVDVVSSLGSNQNVTAHVTKWDLDGNGVRQQYRGRNRLQNDIVLFDESVIDTIEELYEDGEDAVSFDEQTLQFAKNENEFLFVDFYASWCSHCRDLAPTWEALAELMLDTGEHLGKLHHEDYDSEDYEEAEKIRLPVMVGKVDCVIHKEVCQRHAIRAYPTLRLFHNGQPWGGGDYRGHRTLISMVEWLYFVEEKVIELEGGSKDDQVLQIAHQAAHERLLGDNVSDEERQWHEKLLMDRKKVHTKDWRESEHPGCQLSGHLILDRAPGNFHIQARSQNQEFAAHMTNTSHLINSLSVGDPAAKSLVESGRAPKTLPAEAVKKLAPMDGNVYPTYNNHESYHHYLKLVTTQVEGFKIGRRDLRIYQILENSQLALYRNDMIPEAKFQYDLSPIAVTYRSESRRWYEYCTSVMAIIGGVFTVVGMFEAGMHATVKHVHRNQQRRQMRR